jgi:hypothetical protein
MGAAPHALTSYFFSGTLSCLNQFKNPFYFSFSSLRLISSSFLCFNTSLFIAMLEVRYYYLCFSKTSIALASSLLSRILLRLIFWKIESSTHPFSFSMIVLKNSNLSSSVKFYLTNSNNIFFWGFVNYFMKKLNLTFGNNYWYCLLFVGNFRSSLKITWNLSSLSSNFEYVFIAALMSWYDFLREPHSYLHSFGIIQIFSAIWSTSNLVYRPGKTLSVAIGTYSFSWTASSFSVHFFVAKTPSGCGTGSLSFLSWHSNFYIMFFNEK